MLHQPQHDPGWWAAGQGGRKRKTAGAAHLPATALHHVCAQLAAAPGKHVQPVPSALCGPVPTRLLLHMRLLPLLLPAPTLSPHCQATASILHQNVACLHRLPGLWVGPSMLLSTPTLVMVVWLLIHSALLVMQRPKIGLWGIQTHGFQARTVCEAALLGMIVTFGRTESYEQKQPCLKHSAQFTDHSLPAFHPTQHACRGALMELPSGSSHFAIAVALICPIDELRCG